MCTPGCAPVGTANASAADTTSVPANKAAKNLATIQTLLETSSSNLTPSLNTPLKPLFVDKEYPTRECKPVGYLAR